MLFRELITDQLRLKGKGQYKDASFLELLKPVETRTGDEIALEVIRNAGLEVRT